MRKIYLFILFLFFCSINVNAETYYGEYKFLEDISLINEYQFDEILVNENKLFNTYKENYIDMGYMIDNNLYIKNELDFIEEYTLLDDYNIDSDEYINLNSNITNLAYIRFANIPTDIKIYEIFVYYNNKDVSYRYYFSNFEDFIRAFDYKFDTFNYSINDNSFINLNFENNILLENIKIEIYTDDIDINYDIILNGLETKNVNFKGRKHTITFEKSKEDYEYKYGKFLKKYRYYKKELLPTNNYVLNGDKLLLDDYIVDYEYFVRNKLVLKDDIVIQDSNFNINDFILYSNGYVESNCDINIYINGEYNCNFKLNDIKVDKKVIVDISKTKFDIEIEEENIKVNDNIERENDESNIENVIREESSYSDEEYYNYEDNDLVEKNVINSQEYLIDSNKAESFIKQNIGNNVNKNNFLTVVKYIFIVLIIVIDIILFIKKKKRKCNVESI